MPPLTADTIREFQVFLSEIQAVPDFDRARAFRDVCSLFQKLLDITETIEPVPTIRFWVGSPEQEYDVSVEIRRFVSDDFRQSMQQFTCARSKDSGWHVVTAGTPNTILMGLKNNQVPLLRFLQGQLRSEDQSEFDTP